MLDELILLFLSFSQDVAKEPSKEQVKDNVNLFGAAATTPSVEGWGHGQLHRPQEPAEVGAPDQLHRPEEHAPDSKSSEYEGKPATPKKANPFV